MPSLKSRLDLLANLGRLQLPYPGGGSTSSRYRALAAWAAEDLSLARLAEAHTDALAILAEAGCRPRPGLLYGVWASDAPPSKVTCRRSDGGNWRIEGSKLFCSGVGLLGAALVTAHDEAGVRLFDIALDSPCVVRQPSLWKNPAFEDTATTGVTFAGLEVEDRYRLGEPGWYLDRPGFWHGSIAPAACWAGGAISLIDAATRLNRREPHSRAQLGALQATAWCFDAILEQAGREIDADPLDLTSSARSRGLKVRHLMERSCTDVLDRFGRATGPQLLAFDDHVARQHAALSLYIRQCHGERDLEMIPR